MTREEAKELLPIIQAFVEGKAIQDKIEGVTGWCDTDEINFEFEGQKIIHRIKPESQYRPFKNQEECWNEMLKHQPFGWLKRKTDGSYHFISEMYSLSELFTKAITVTPTHELVPYSTTMFSVYTFADGIPFGVKIE